MGEETVKEIETKIIDTIFNLEAKFDEIGDMFRDLGRLLSRFKKASRGG